MAQFIPMQVVTWKQPGFQKFRRSIVTEVGFFLIPEKSYLSLLGDCLLAAGL